MVNLISTSATFDALELAAVLAGLRLLQLAGDDLPPDVEMIATDCGQYPPLTDDQIDDLCERLNFG